MSGAKGTSKSNARDDISKYKHLIFSDVSEDLAAQFASYLDRDTPLDVLSQSCLLLIQHLKADAETHISNKAFILADECYRVAIQHSRTFYQSRGVRVWSEEEEAVFFCNKSFARYKMEDFEGALEDANFCTYLDKDNIKGYWRASQAHKVLHSSGEAIVPLLMAMSIMKSPSNSDDFVRFMIEAASLIPQVKGPEGWRKMRILQVQRSWPIPVWLRIIKHLYEKQDFFALATLTIGSKQVAESPIHHIAAVPGLSYKFADVGKMLGILKDREGTTMSWHLKLAEFMIKRGADIFTIAKYFQKPLLVAMTMLSLEGEVSSFMHLVWDKLSPCDYDQKDEEGNTPFHVVAKCLKPLTLATEMVCKDLVSHGCLATEKDKKGKQAIHYMTLSHRGYSCLKDFIEKPGNHFLKRVKAIKEEGNNAFKENKHSQAILCYSNGIALAIKFPELKKELAVLHSNTAAVYLKTENYNLALKAADKSLEADQSFFKAHFRKGQALSKLGQYYDACDAFISGYYNTSEDNIKPQFAKDAAALVSDIPEPKRNTIIVQEMKIMLCCTWPSVLEALSKEKMWAQINILVKGPPYDDSGGRDKNPKKKGIMGCSDATKAALSTIFEVQRGQMDVPALVKELLSQGAKPENLAPSTKETHFHTAVKFCFHFDDTEVLDQILAMDPDGRIKSARDSEQRTPFHILCLEIQKDRKVAGDLSQRIAKSLLQYSVDPLALDVYQRKAVDYSKHGSSFYDFMLGISGKKTQPPKVNSKPRTTKPQEKTKPSNTRQENNKAGNGKPQNVKSEKVKSENVKSEKVKSENVKSENVESENVKSENVESETENPITGIYWLDCKLRGNDAFGDREYDAAISWYTKAIKGLEEEIGVQNIGILDEIDGHNLSVLYGNRSECWYKLDENKNFFEDAKKSVDFDSTWFKGHFRVGRAFQTKGKYTSALQAFINAFNKLGPDEGEEDRTIILSDITETAILAGKPDLTELPGVTSNDWVAVAYEYMVKKRWDMARHSFNMVTTPPEAKVEKDLKLFCDRSKIKDHEWICSMLMWLFKSGTDFSSLKFHEGDTYFHATLTIVILSGLPPGLASNIESSAIQLMKLVVDKKVVPNKDMNITDDKGNSVLHILTNLRGNEKMREFVALYLIQRGVDFLMRNKDGKLAIDLTTKSDVLRIVFQRYMDEDAAIRKHQEQLRSNAKIPQSKAKRNEKTAVKPILKECDECAKNLEEAFKWQKQENYRQAFSKLVEVINSRHQQDPRHKEMRKKSIERVVVLLTYDVAPKIPQTLVSINADSCREILVKLASAGKWLQLEALVIDFKVSKGQKALSGFARNLSLLDLVKDTSFCGQEGKRLNLISLLVGHDASLDVSTSAIALETAMKHSEWQVALKLLELGANPKGLTFTPGDTPCHAALVVALEKNPGNFVLLNKLRDLYVKDKTRYNYLEVNSQDKDGNTVLHLAVQAPFNQHSLHAVERLCEWNAKADIANNDGRFPIQYLKEKDRRAQYVRNTNVAMETSTGSTVKKASSSSSRMRQQNQGQDDVSSSSLKGKTDVYHLLMAMPDVSYNFLQPLKDSRGHHSSEEDEDENSDEEEDDESDDEMKTSDMEEMETSDVDEEDNDYDGTMDVKNFDTLEWDVECTEEVWHLLRGKSKYRLLENETGSTNLKKEKISDAMKRLVVKRIHQLATGNWRSNLQQQVQGVPDSLRLFKVKLPKGGCILWELAIAFSPRRSGGSENHQVSDNGDGMGKGRVVRGGRVYSELIRVWNILLRPNDEKFVVESIVRSHQRGQTCIIKTNLTGLNVESKTSQHVPLLYIESDTESQANVKVFPPASASQNEFHILKFYTFSSLLASAVLDHIDFKIDFPFKVTPIEHAIIHLASKSPILLLGRSGTGKTTCCLYRLWSSFDHYWEEKEKCGSAWLPRVAPPPSPHEDENEEMLNIENVEEKENPGKLKQNRQVYDPRDNKAEDFRFLDDGYKEAKDMEDNSDKETDESEDEFEDDYESQYENLHQLFVTKNPVLCSEVEKNFLKLRHASNSARLHNAEAKGKLPNTLQEIEDLAYPLFLTSKQLLLMLDASVDVSENGKTFFPRDEDLALKVTIPGWGTQEDIFNMTTIDFLSSDEDDVEDGVPTKKTKKSDNSGARPKLRADPRRECTYDVFANEIWPKIGKKIQMDCHPSLVWTEIVSFIKGSYEALQFENGHLDQKKYLELGRKRAPNFSGDRSQVYEAFLKYHSYSQKHGLFDESDIVFRIYTRHRNMTIKPWTIHEIYVDETQDFTQAELTLLVSLCPDPNKMFLTGDTAQSIMRGIAFRFSDLQALFYYANETAKESKQYSEKIVVPHKVNQLTHNYRSHTGILSLASAVLDILTELFPESFDQLEKDQGMFSGPKPILIESCSSEDLALLLTGSRRQTSHIEFGAHQAIIVVNEEAKNSMPEELSSGIVLTIYESKGLEFDDVLIYNFFKDSQAMKEWRVVTELLELSRQKKEQTSSKGNNLIEIDSEVLSQPNRPRPLQFDPNLHKVLNAELKHLYTAFTRARVNIWIFDQDEEKRAPMFEYFKARKLVKPMGSQEDEISDDTTFTETSSDKDWKSAGENFMSKKLYQVAAKCFSKAKEPEKEKLALAYQTALEASKLKNTPREMRSRYCKAGEQFVACRVLHRAALCFQNAHEFALSALAFEKNGQFEEACGQYLRAKKMTDASRCLEQLGKFGRAVRLLADNKCFDLAIDCLQRYKITVKKVEEEGKPLPSILSENKPNAAHSEKNLCFSSAEQHHAKGDKEKALAAIMRVKDITAQKSFLIDNGYIEQATELMITQGDTEQAARLMLKHGFTDKALEYAELGFHKSLTATIHLVLARKYQTQTEQPFDLELINHHASKAQVISLELDDYDGQAKAKVILGRHKVDTKLMKEAYHDFGKTKPKNLAGMFESYGDYLEIVEKVEKVEDCPNVLRHISMGFQVLQSLLDPQTENQETHQLCLRFYGLEQDPTKQKLTWHPHEYPLYLQYLKPQPSSDQLPNVSGEKTQVVQTIAKHIIARIKSWSVMLSKVLAKFKSPLLPCRDYLRGLSCDTLDCCFLHRTYESLKEETDVLTLLDYSVTLDYHLQTGLEQIGKYHMKSELSLPLDKDLGSWQSVKDLLEFILPTIPSPLRRDQEYIKKLVTKLRSLDKTVAQVGRYLTYLWKNPGRVGRGRSEDVMKERCKSTDWIVQASLFASLLKLEKTVNVSKEVNELEKELLHKKKDWYWKDRKYALFTSRKDGEVYLEAVGTRFVESFKMLTFLKQDVYESLFPFTKMISTLGKRGCISLMPDLKHLTLWMEIYYPLTWCFIAKASATGKRQNPFLMTNGLFANIYLLNTCIEMEKGSKKAKNLLQLVVLHQFDEKLKFPGNFVLKRQDHLSNFLVGHNQYSRFSLIGRVGDLCTGKEPSFLLAGRIVVLSLVVLLNIPSGHVSPQYEVPIRKELFKLPVTEQMPKNLATLLTEVKKATTYQEIAASTLTFLQQEGSDLLLKCNWAGRLSCPVQFSDLKPTEYPQMDFYDTDIAKLADDEFVQEQEKRSHPQTDVTDKTEDMDEEDLEKAQEKMAQFKEEDRKKMAGMKILRWVKVQVMRHRLMRKKYRDFKLREMFRPFDVTEIYCGLCGESVEQKKMKESVDETGDTEHPDQVSEVTHLDSEKHKNNFRGFEIFKQRYCQEVHGTFEEMKQFLSKHKVQKNSDIYKSVQPHVIEVLDKWHNFEGCLDDMLTRRMWEKATDVFMAFSDLRKTFGTNRHILETQFLEFEKRQKMDQPEGAGQQEFYTQDLDQEMVEPKPIDPIEDKAEQYGQGPGQHYRGQGYRNRKKPRQNRSGFKNNPPPRFQRQAESKKKNY